MTSLIDETHDPQRQSWVASAQGHVEFPIQNLALGIFSVQGDAPRGGVAIGDEVIFRASARRDGYVPIGFGECRGRIS